ncbi:glycyl-tRNA synthetase subunit beta [Dyella thiooxydans]|uniref:Glycine--tRNA ligase beta subunit n=1 Tax=Dyella thiooxydans TaxID=445710 RepID=A0A161IW01_9GAMM|nr:glycine--tRNA ligase subunit beta [Dyella thiooxydans]AND70539.1 glycyl-tRNA synthetase subunit beta [Dyella thiooxydans]
MSAAKPLLIELGTEELPPKALDELAAAFARGVCDGLARRGIEAGLDAARVYATPRRLAVYVPDVAFAQPEQVIERRGPAVSAGIGADGQPAKALLGFAQSCGVGVDALEKLETDKGAWFVYRSVKPGQLVADLVPEIVAEALKALPIPKPMRWSDHDYSFVRPVHWLVMLHGTTIIDGEVLGLKSGRKSRGHRFMHPQPIHVVDADSWEDALLAAKVIADPAVRRARIRDEVARVAAQTGGVPRLDDALLDEIANLTEWPVAIACTFEPEFLAVPPEALVTTMEANQKFVPVFDAEGQLTEHFIGIANVDSRDPAEIRKGYERVIRPRFADAKFFWDEDLKTPLASYQEALKNVTYQQSLGSLWDKTVRVAELARVIASRVGVDAGATTRAASLAKCDLLTRMVGEFPELQGVMGRYYASRQGEPEAVALALDSFYQPRFAGDAIAADAVGRVIAVAERLDTLAGIFAVGLKPSGSKDPFALRRAALGLARTLVEAGLEIDLDAAFAEALELLPDAALQAGIKPARDGSQRQLDAGQRRAELRRELHEFVLDRLRGYYAERGFDGQSFEAVLAVAPASLADFDRRLRALADFSRRPEAGSLAAANKRVANLLRKQAEESGAAVARAVDPARFELPAERALADALEAADRDTREAWDARDYGRVLERLALLQGPVDAFFDAVLVNAEDPAVRANRLALLAHLKSQFSAVADIALL